MWAFINQNISYIAIALVIAIAGFIKIQSIKIEHLNQTINNQNVTITNQVNKIESLESDINDIRKLEDKRKNTRQQALKNKISIKTEDAKNDKQGSEKKINEAMSKIINDINEASK